MIVRVVLICLTALAAPLSAQVVISEFLANNTRTLADENGDHEDWIEIHNAGASAVDLSDWSLTDDATDLTKWRFPSINLAARGYLIVWASNKNRRSSGNPLHTNFKLDGDGEYLALVRPDGTTVTEFAPVFPPQLPDVSYGPAAQVAVTNVIQQGTSGRVLVPADGSLGTSWTGAGFNDAAWTNATNGIGFETGANEFGTDYPADVLADAPAGYWRLEESGSGANVSLANAGTAGSLANGLTAGNPVLAVAGPQPPAEAGMPAANRALRTSTGNYAEVPFHPSLNHRVFTVECWARPTGGAGLFRSPVSGRNDTGTTYGYIIYAANNNTWQFWTGSGGSGVWEPVTGPAVTLNVWTHLAATFDGTTKRLYVNGAPAASRTSSNFNPNTERPLRIGAGRNEQSPDFYFPGDVDEVAVFDRALTAAEISQRYQLGRNNTAPPPATNYTGLISTDLQASMHNVNATAWLRLPFTVAEVSAVDRLTLKMKYDDGFHAYLNGIPVASGNAPPALNWNSAASERSSTAEALAFESFNLNDRIGTLQNGTNVLAIHGLNLSAANPDFLQLAQLELTDVGAYSAAPVYLTAPTPGDVNTSGSATPGPSISEESHAPQLPAATDDLTVTCRVRQVFSPIAAVSMKWRTGFNAEQSVMMSDEGTAGDLTAGDGIYTAIIAKTNYAAGNMVRWYFTAQDTAANTTRWPLFNVPDNSPQYFGTMVAASGFTTTLPVWYWFAQATGAAATRTGTFGAVFHHGEFYDNVFIRLRGGATSTGSKKFDFNTGSHCLINETVGRVEEANLNGSSLGGAETIIRPPVAFELMRRAGHPACASFPVMMRVNGALDTGSGRGGVAYFVEQVDERFLRRHGFDPDGALYKMDQRGTLEPVFTDTTDGVQKRTRLHENNSDLQALVNAVHSSAPDDWAYNASPVPPVFPPGFTTLRTTKLFDLMDMANLTNYLAARIIIGDTDDTRKNFYLYRDSDGDREWRIFPWDKDGTLGLALDAAPYVGHPYQADYAHRKVNSFHQWNYLYEGCFNEPKIRAMLLRRLRTLMDTVLGPAVGGPETFTDSIWAPIPATVPAITAFNGVTPNSIKSFFNIRRNGAASSSTSSGLFTVYSAANGLGAGVQIPAAQPPGAVVNIGQIEFLPASGNQLEEFVEIQNPNSFDIDLSGWQLEGGIDHRFEPGTVIRASDVMYLANNKNAFRARTTGPRGGQDRFIQGGFNGSLSARGETIQIWDRSSPGDDRLVTTGTYPPAPTAAQQSLRITELMYDPPAGGSFASGEYEYIEFTNIGVSPLDLHGVTFTDGVTFTFPSMMLNAGGRTLAVKNLAAFESRYGTGLPVAGTYTGSLDNSGERIRLVDAVGEEVLDFRYEGTWYPSTHGSTVPGGGSSLVIVDANAAWDTWPARARWRASGGTNGSPAVNDPLPPAARVTSVSGASINLSGVPGRSYLLQRSTDLITWSDVTFHTAAADGRFTASDPDPVAARACYRVVSH